MIDIAQRIADLALLFGEVERATEHPDGRAESDTTHTVMLALAAIELAPPSMDSGRLVSFAIVHDLVEAIPGVGDTNTAWGLTERAREAKEARERMAIEKLRELELERIVALIESYERQDMPEARWIRYVDKVMPKLTHLANGGAALRRIGMAYADMLEKHAEQGRELAERYPEQEHARALFEAAVLRCEADLYGKLDAIGTVVEDGAAIVELNLAARVTPDQEREAYEAWEEHMESRRMHGHRALVWAEPLSTKAGCYPRVLAMSESLARIGDADEITETLDVCDQHPIAPGFWIWSGWSSCFGEDAELELRGEFGRPSLDVLAGSLTGNLASEHADAVSAKIERLEDEVARHMADSHAAAHVILRANVGPEMLRECGCEECRLIFDNMLAADLVHESDWPNPDTEARTFVGTFEMHDHAVVDPLIAGRDLVSEALCGLPDFDGFADSIAARAKFIRGLHPRRGSEGEPYQTAENEARELDALAEQVRSLGRRGGYTL